MSGDMIFKLCIHTMFDALESGIVKNVKWFYEYRFFIVFLAHFPLEKESYCPHFVRPSVRPSVTASSLQGVVGLGWFIACSKAYEPRIWIMVKKILGIDPGRGQEGLKSLILYIFLEYLWTFYKCVCEWER